MKTSRLACLILCIVACAVHAEDTPKNPIAIGYQDTPMLPSGKWHVHDGQRPQPRMVTPGEAPGKPPSDALVLFDGTNLDKWTARNGKPSGWKVENGTMQVAAKGTENGGDIVTKDSFGDIQLHVEWTSPNPPRGDGQGRGNSGIFLMGRYEFQVLDCYRNPTYPDGQAAALYGQTPPLMNACAKPGEWNVYDIVFIAPRFNNAGKLESPAYVTAFHNGVLVHNKKALIGSTEHRKVGSYTPHGDKAPIHLQDHGDPVAYRNIWLRELTDYDQPEEKK